MAVGKCQIDLTSSESIPEALRASCIRKTAREHGTTADIGTIDLKDLQRIDHDENKSVFKSFRVKYGTGKGI